MDSVAGYLAGGPHRIVSSRVRLRSRVSQHGIRAAKAATTSGLRGGGLTSFAEPNTTITTGAEHRNRDKRPLIWRRTADDITAKVQRARDALRQIKTQTEH